MSGMDLCPKSQRDDGGHAWRFDGDDPYIVCAWCDRMQDALSGRVIREGSAAVTGDGAYGHTTRRHGRDENATTDHPRRCVVNAVRLPWELQILAGQIEDELSVWADRDPQRHHPDVRRSADRACHLIGDLIAGLGVLRDEVTGQVGVYDDERRRLG